MPKGQSKGPRKQRPVFAIVNYTDESGNSVKLNQSGLNIKIERDSANIVEMLTGDGSDMGNASVVRVELPQPTQRKAADTASA